MIHQEFKTPVGQFSVVAFTKEKNGWVPIAQQDKDNEWYYDLLDDDTARVFVTESSPYDKSGYDRIYNIPKEITHTDNFFGDTCIYTVTEVYFHSFSTKTPKIHIPESIKNIYLATKGDYENQTPQDRDLKKPSSSLFFDVDPGNQHYKSDSTGSLYKKDNGNITLVLYSKYIQVEDFRQPLPQIDSRTTAIAEFAFQEIGREDMLTIPQGVTKILPHTFCSVINTKLNITANNIRIDKDAFSCYTNLRLFINSIPYKVSIDSEMREVLCYHKWFKVEEIRFAAPELPISGNIINSNEVELHEALHPMTSLSIHDKLPTDGRIVRIAPQGKQVSIKQINSGWKYYDATDVENGKIIPLTYVEMKDPLDENVEKNCKRYLVYELPKEVERLMLSVGVNPKML